MGGLGSDKTVSVITWPTADHSYYCTPGLQRKITLRLQSAILFSIFLSQGLIDQLVEDVKHVRPAVEKTRPNVVKNPDVDRLEEDVNRMAKRWGNCCMQVLIITRL